MLNRRIFRLSSGIGFACIATLAVLFFGAKQAFPFFIGNVGTFMIKSDSIEADTFELALGVDENSGEDGGALPTGVITLGSATLQGLVLEKAVDVSSVVGNVAQPEWKLRLVSSQPVALTGATINAIGLCADNFVATGLAIDAKGAETASFLDDFSLASESVSLTGAGIEAGYLASSSLSVQGLTVTVEPGGYDKAACLP